MIISAHQPYYLPWLPYMAKIAEADRFVLLDSVQFEKNSFQNRNRIKGPAGPIWVTVPVHLSGLYHKPAREIEIEASPGWRRKHWQSLQAHYGRAAYFQRYAGFLEEVYGRTWQHIVDLNRHLLSFLLEAFGINTEVLVESELGAFGASNERLIGLCRYLGGHVYLSGRGAKDYQDERLFADAGVEVVYQEFHYPVYRQCYGGFQPGLSSLDLLLNHGPDSLAILRGEVAVDRRPGAGLIPLAEVVAALRNAMAGEAASEAALSLLRELADRLPAATPVGPWRVRLAGSDEYTDLQLLPLTVTFAVKLLFGEEGPHLLALCGQGANEARSGLLADCLLPDGPDHVASVNQPLGYALRSEDGGVVAVQTVHRSSSEWRVLALGISEHLDGADVTRRLHAALAQEAQFHPQVSRLVCRAKGPQDRGVLESLGYHAADAADGCEVLETTPDELLVRAISQGFRTEFGVVSSLRRKGLPV